MKKLTLIIFTILITSFTIGFISKPTVQIKEQPKTILHQNFHFMTNDGTLYQITYSHQSDELEVWKAVRSVILSHNSEYLSQPDIYRILEEEIFDSHDLNITIHEIKL